MPQDTRLVIPKTLRIRLTTGQIIQLSLDDYLKGVVPTEMGLKKPMEALKAQAIASRSYAVTTRRHAQEGFDACDTTHCQVYRPKNRYPDSDRAVDETTGQVIVCNGKIVATPFFGHCDGHTRNSEDVWSGRVSYLRKVRCTCGYSKMYGHGVDMCQRGAAAMASRGATAEDILKHYYRDVQVSMASHIEPTSFQRSIILGTTVDLVGKPRPGIPLLLKGPRNTIQRRSNANGDFWISGLPAGNWTLEVKGTAIQYDNLVTDGRNTLKLRILVPDIPKLRVKTTPLAYPSEFAGTLGFNGVQVHIQDPAGNQISVLSGTSETFNPGGFSIPVTRLGSYRVDILDQTFNLEVQQNGLWIEFLAR